MTDFIYMDRMAELISARSMPRLLYKKGITLEGIFTPYMNMSGYTKAGIFNCTENDTPVTVRLSKVFGMDGEADTARDVISLCTRFHDEGNVFDLIAHNIDIGESMRSPEYILKLIEILCHKKSDSGSKSKAVCINKDNVLLEKGLEDAVMMRFVLDYLSDRTTIKSYRYVEAYSLNEYLFSDESGVHRRVKFRWCPLSGIRCISRNEAEFLAGYDPDVATYDIMNAIKEKKYPEYELEGAIEGEGKYLLGLMKLTGISEQNVNDTIQFSPSNITEGISLEETEFNSFTTFAFNESRRFRGGMR